MLRAPKAKPGSDRPGEVGEAPAAPERQAVIARLTARLRLPRAAIDPALLPHELLEPLEKAGLAGPDSLPAAAMTALAMVAPVAGPCVGLAPAEPGSRLGRATGIGLRVCLLVNNRDLPALPPAVAGAAHAVQNALLTRHRAALALSTAQERIAAERRTLYAQAVRAAAALGHAPPPPLPQADLLGPGAPPRILVEDGAGAALVKAAGGGTGVLLVDERRMATLPRAGHGDPQTAALLNAAALGHPIATQAGPAAHVVMRTLPVGVVGVLTAAECEGLLTATPEMLVGTAFVPAFPPPPGGDPASLADLALRVHALASVDPVMLAFAGAAATALAAAAQRWTADLDRSLQPLSACLAQLPDLAQRLAVALHLVAAAGEGKLAAEIGAGTVRRAVALVETFILPVARTLLSAVSSASAVEADALRLVAALRRHTSLEDPVIDKREWQRATQTTVPSARFKAAVRLLERLALIAPAPPPADRKGGEYFTVARAIHADA
ncbi:MAG TPA: hypothetical protein VFP74_03435 [Pseudolabrys sp.]|nr:hypothetical protein [Pseudolabrys sp.]